uniref:DUF4236 domain-containing protein n=1 Tax=Siphoviridae sp. ctGz830 TaxID=2827825 RepID=A0A8S5TAC9_9CAUD|nr:MAG TPA: Protein of unknown function (DUF4236) [Siphoviridae sp. ctGz830]
MDLRFKKSVKLGKGLKLNVSKNGLSVSAGVKGARVSMNSKGKVKGTVGLPGTGLSYSSTLNSKSKAKANYSNIQFDNGDSSNISNDINDKNNNDNGFKIRFLSKDNILFYATEKTVEFTVNYGTKKAQFHFWKTEDITRVEVVNDKMVFGTETIPYGVLFFDKESESKVKRFQSIIESKDIGVDKTKRVPYPNFKKKQSCSVGCLAVIFALIGLWVLITSLPRNENSQDIVYTTKIVQQSTKISECLINISELLTNIDYSSKWKLDVANELVKLDGYIQEAKDTVVPEKFKEVHKEYLKGLDGYKYLVDNLPKSIDNLDTDLIKKCGDKMSEGNNHIKKAVEEMEKVKK